MSDSPERPLIGDNAKDISVPCIRHDDDVNVHFYGNYRPSETPDEDGIGDEKDTDDVIQDGFTDMKQSVACRSFDDMSIDVGLVNEDVSGRLVSGAATSSSLDSIPDNCDSLSDSNHSSEPESIGYLLDEEEEWMQSFHDFEEFLSIAVPSKLTSSEVGWILLPSNVSSHERHVSDLLKEWKRLQENDTPVNFPLMRNLAVKHHVLCGKWMIFRRSGVHADLTWIVIARAHKQGKLGISAKISTSPKENDHVICVYCDDFTNTKDVYELESKLRDVGMRCRMLYKPDVFTHCNIYSRNEWKMRPYIYTSTYDIKTKQSIIVKQYDYDYSGNVDDLDHHGNNDGDHRDDDDDV